MSFSLFHQRELLEELTKREIKQRYKQSILGYAWVVLNPFLQMLVMSFVFKFLLRFNNLGVPYAVFLFVGLLPWNLFAQSLSATVNSLVANAGLLTKVYFPREVFIVSTILAKLVDFGWACLVLAGMLVWYHIPVTWQVWWVVVILAIQLLFIYGLSLILAAFNLFYRDIQHLLNLILLLWMYLTPVIYPTELFPQRYAWIFQINPMSVFINAYRQVILAGSPPNLVSLGIGLLLSVLMVIVGQIVFDRLEGRFADVV